MEQRPDYIKIFNDIILKKFPEKREIFKCFLEKENLSGTEIVKLNELIFSNKQHTLNQKHKAYSKSDIFYILSYQKKKKLSNSQLANYFNISRNTITKWKKQFL